jgi:hypothetical protein
MDIVTAGLDFTPITSNLVAFLGTVVTGVATWALAQGALWLQSKTSLAKSQQAEQLQQTFNEAIHRGIAWAETQTNEKAATYVKNVDLPGGTFVDLAAQYVINHWPDLIKRSGLTTEKVVEAVTARLTPASAVADAIAAAKVTPVVVAPTVKK